MPHRVRAEARAVLARLDPPRGIESLAAALANGELAEKQLAMIPCLPPKTRRPEGLLAQWLDRLNRSDAPPEVQLDVIEAARRQGAAALKEKLARYSLAVPPGEVAGGYCGRTPRFAVCIPHIRPLGPPPAAGVPRCARIELI